MVQVENVVKDYHAGETIVHALRSVSLALTDGEFAAIAGPSGSGKTTLLNLIGCIDRADSGNISVDGTAVSSMDRKALALFRRKNLGFVFQTFNLIPVLSAYENVAFVLSLLDMPPGDVRERTKTILAEVGLDGMTERLPSRLSGGQQQRVAIARALVKNPTLVLADEPTANLDSDTGRAILDLMEKMNTRYGTTFLFSTHDPMVMEFAHRLVSLHDGKIVEDRRRET